MVQYTLNNLIKEYLIRIGESNENKYARYYQLGIDYLRESNMDKSGFIKSVEIPINHNDTIDLPPDFIDYRFIGLADKLGNLRAMQENPNLSIVDKYTNCGSIKKEAHPMTAPSGSNLNQATGEIVSADFILELLYPYDANFVNGECVGRFFGIGGGNNQNGEFRINKNDGTIVISKHRFHAHKIVMEYLSNIAYIGGDFIVAPQIVDALKAYLDWKGIINNKNVPIARIGYMETVFNNADRWAKRRYMSHTLSDWASAWRSGNVAAAKW